MHLSLRKLPSVYGLSIFVDRQTIKALADTSEKHLDVLININKNLAEGLLAQTENPEVEASVSSTKTAHAQPDVAV